MEVEVIRAKCDGCYVLIEMDANAKVGERVIKSTPHNITNNGKIMMDIVEQKNLTIANSLDF